MCVDKNMGNSNPVCGVERELINYDPRDYVNIPEGELDLHPFSYPNFGLYRPFSDLETHKTAILEMPLEEQAKYSDAITRRYALNPHFKRLQLQRINISTDIDKNAENSVNVTSIGNTAFMALFNPLEPEWKAHYNVTIELAKKQWS